MTYPKTLESDANSRTLVDDSVYDCGVKLCRFEILMPTLLGVLCGIPAEGALSEVLKGI